MKLLFHGSIILHFQEKVKFWTNKKQHQKRRFFVEFLKLNIFLTPNTLINDA